MGCAPEARAGKDPWRGRTPETLVPLGGFRWRAVTGEQTAAREAVGVGEGKGVQGRPGPAHQGRCACLFPVPCRVGSVRLNVGSIDTIEIGRCCKLGPFKKRSWL